jgi:RNA polymerase sigma-70 factor (ECF subfamily)
MRSYETNASGSSTPHVMERLSAKRADFLRFVAKRVESLEVAEDILQASYLRAIEHLGELRDASRVEAWFYRFLRYAIVDHYRRSAATSEVTVEQPLPEPQQPPAAPTPCPCAVRELTNIRKEYSQALETVEMQDVPVHAYAGRERITPGNASVRLHRARKALAQRIQLVCGPCAGAGCFDCGCA